VSSHFVVAKCRRCGYLAYPPRIVCPTCGNTEFGRQILEEGTVTEVTVRRPVTKRRQLPWGNWLDQHATRLAAITSDLGPRIVALVPDGVGVGDRVTLRSQASTAIALPGQVVEGQPLLPGGAVGEGGPRVGTPQTDYPGRGR
jgi:uncharacterized OB-fold protein